MEAGTKSETGLIHVYTGDGKGKTTAALGLATRAVGHGKMVHMVQFLKGSSYSGELFAAPRLFPQLQITQFGWGCPWSSQIRSGQGHCTGCGECFRNNRDPEISLAKHAFKFSTQLVHQGEYDIIILDEISHPIRHKLLEADRVVQLLKEKPHHVELVLTGRRMAPEIMEVADYVTELVPHKHPFQKGIESRRGIEY